MPNGQLSCLGGCYPGYRRAAVLRVYKGGEKVARICEDCARDDYALRSFLVACGRLYGWSGLRFTYVGVAQSGLLRLALMAAVDEEESRAYECQQARSARNAAWAIGAAPSPYLSDG
jgi:hypothetical protein